MHTGPDRKHTRLPGYDYREPGPYVVTICTQHRIPRFGRVDDGQMILNPIGQMVEKTWHTLPARFPGTSLDAFVLMPNHLHAIITLSGPDEPSLEGLPSLSDVVGWFKTMTTRRYARGVNTHGWTAFDRHLWQPSFYDHIVRGSAGLERQRRYIEANPASWIDDPYREAER